MKNEHIIRTNRFGDFTTLIGRILIGGVFLIAGIQKMIGFSGTADWIAAVGFPLAITLTVVAILIELIAGFTLIIGYHTKITAFVLAGFVLLITPFFHNPIYADQLLLFSKNLMILGGLLFISAFGAGRISIDHKILKNY